MSAENIEFGDLFECFGFKIFITCVVGNKEIGAISFMDNRDGHHCTDSYSSFDNKIKSGVIKYIGKSKVSVNDLFELK